MNRQTAPDSYRPNHLDCQSKAAFEKFVVEQVQRWDKELPGCMPPPFAAPFGLHPHDRGRALNWAESLRNRGITWPDAKAQIVAYLRSINTSREQIEKQTERARSLIAHRL